jgi:dethiobiotin synthetase
VFGSLSEAGRRVAVVGTGTEIGKTHVSCALLQAWCRRGLDVRGFKPVESGWDPEKSDAAMLSRAGGHGLIVPSFALRDPVSPHLAARREGVEIALGRVTRELQGLGGTILLIETAGGLLSPLGVGKANLDLVVACEVDEVVLVASNRLGVLHDVRACLLALEGLNGVRRHVVLSAGVQGDASTTSNADEIVALNWADVCWSFPRSALESAETMAVADGLAGALLG